MSLNFEEEPAIIIFTFYEDGFNSMIYLSS